METMKCELFSLPQALDEVLFGMINQITQTFSNITLLEYNEKNQISLMNDQYEREKLNYFRRSGNE